MCDDGCLDSNCQVLLITTVLENDSESVIYVTDYTSVGAEESGDGGWAAKQGERLIEGVCSYKTSAFMTQL